LPSKKASLSGGGRLLEGEETVVARVVDGGDVGGRG